MVSDGLYLKITYFSSFTHCIGWVWDKDKVFPYQFLPIPTQFYYFIYIYIYVPKIYKNIKYLS